MFHEKRKRKENQFEKYLENQRKINQEEENFDGLLLGAVEHYLRKLRRKRWKDALEIAR